MKPTGSAGRRARQNKIACMCTQNRQAARLPPGLRVFVCLADRAGGKGGEAVLLEKEPVPGVVLEKETPAHKKPHTVGCGH